MNILIIIGSIMFIVMQRENRLPNVPKEFENHLVFADRGKGSCHSMTGEILYTVIFVDDEGGSWTEEEKEQFKNDLKKTLKMLEDAKKL